jgi:hypothetical protein
MVKCIVLTTARWKILLGGAFTSFNGVTANRLIRLNNDGSIDALSILR